MFMVEGGGGKKVPQGQDRAANDRRDWGAGMLGQLPGLTTPENPVLPHMRLFQRFEVWLLLIAGGIAVVWSFKADAPPADDSPTANATSGAALQLRRCTLERDFGNARLDLEIRYRNASPRPLFMQPPDVRLLKADGSEVPPFILPSERPASVAAHATADIRLRYWLDKADLQGPLTLDIRGQTLVVKNDTPLDLEKLENTKPRVWTDAAWVP